VAIAGNVIALPDYPALAALPALRAALAKTGRAVLAAPPGSGKTTTIPLALLDEPWLRGQRIVMLEPRRVAARASAARMASLLGERVGETVGYQVRFERKVSSATRIEVITEGLLTRRLQADPELPGVGLVIFDEFHERSLDADLALALTMDVRANLRDDLRVLVMSATLDIHRVAAALGDAPVVEAGGTLFPIELRYATPKPGTEPASAVVEGVMQALASTEGDILAFLPGGREIRSAQRGLEVRAGSGVSVHPLYGDLSSAEQDSALAPARDGRRKVILATNIAQTSLTVEGVTTVVDSGLARVARFDLGAGTNRLETQRISRASADQRAGRAGRLGPGTAIRLWSRDAQGQLSAHDTPDILAADLTRFALELAVWGVVDPSSITLLDAPPAAAWGYARDLLTALGAIDAGGRITVHGRALSRLPASPRIGHLLLVARDRGHAEAASWLAAILEDGSPAFDLASVLQNARAGRIGEANAQRRIRESARQFSRLVDAGEDDSLDGDAAGTLVALAYPERIARRRGEARGVFLCADGSEARVHERETLAGVDWLAIAHWGVDTVHARAARQVLSAAALSERELLRDHADRIETVTDVRWDPQTAAVIAETQTRIGAIVLSRKPARGGTETAIRVAMLEGIRELGLNALPWTEAARQWQARVLSLRAWRPQEDWPDVSDSALLTSLDDWLAPALGGITRRDHLTRLDLMALLESPMDYAQRQRLAKLAPTHLAVPSGSRVALEYAVDGAPPVLPVKLQELFGLTQTPSVDEGRMRASLHLLSPGRRPIQVTRDLAGFWSRTYPEVKKELKGRYPRHPWPDDPLAALPTARAKPRPR
jgi:ATP-dependent helicase HrpB